MPVNGKHSPIIFQTKFILTMKFTVWKQHVS